LIREAEQNAIPTNAIRQRTGTGSPVHEEEHVSAEPGHRLKNHVDLMGTDNNHDEIPVAARVINDRNGYGSDRTIVSPGHQYTVLPDRGKPGAASDESDVDSGLVQSHSVDTPDDTGTVNEDFHLTTPTEAEYVIPLKHLP
jgi:hypothetical protein